jgi:hypothetical protein
MSGSAPWLTGSLDQLLPQQLLGLNPLPRLEEEPIRTAGVSQRRPVARGGVSTTPERNAEINTGFLDMLAPGPLDVAATIALGPGGRAIRPLAAGAVAGLGEAFPAEGSWLNLRQLLGAAAAGPGRYTKTNPYHNPATQGYVEQQSRKIAADALAQYESAVKAFNSDPTLTAPLRNPAQYSGNDINQAFRDTAPSLYNQTGWIRTPEEWLHLAPSHRGENATAGVINSIAPSWTDKWRPLLGPEWPSLPGQRPFIQDPLLETASPELRNVRISYGSPANMPTTAGLFSPPGEASHLGGFIGLRNDVGVDRLPNVLRHEIQHVLQHQRNAPSYQRGSSSTMAWDNNPELRDEYFKMAAADENVPGDDVERWARRGMYMSNPGEWEARTAGDALTSARMQGKYSQPTRSYFDPFSAFPDFRVR